MPPTLAETRELPPTPKYKMMLLHDEYMTDVSGNRGRFPGGAVLLVDEATAFRWYDNNVAEPADPDAEVFGEIKRRNKREEFLKLAKPATGVFDKAIGRDAREAGPIMPPLMPTRRKSREDLVGARMIDTADEDEG